MFSKKPIFKEVVYQSTGTMSSEYMVQVIKLADTHYDTYGIVNSNTEVIEGVQTVLSQAIDMADTFQKWMDEKRIKWDKEAYSEEELESVIELIEEPKVAALPTE